MPNTHQCHALCIHIGITVIMRPNMATWSHTLTLHHTCHSQGQWCQIRASFGNSITACTDGGSFITNSNGARQDRTLNVKRTQARQWMVSQSAGLLFTQTVRQGPNICQSRPTQSLREQLLRGVLPELEGARPDNLGFLKCPPSSSSNFTNSILFFKYMPFLYKYSQLLRFYAMEHNKCSDVSERIGSGGCWSDKGEENMLVMLKGWR